MKISFIKKGGMKWLWPWTSETIESVIKNKQSRVDTDKDKKGGMKWLWQ